MISRNRLKYFASLHHKKYRKQHGTFLAEGEKIVREILSNPESLLKPVTLIRESSFELPVNDLPPDLEVLDADASELKKISSLSTSGRAVLEIKIPRYRFSPSSVINKACLLFDDIRDPGNLGTIVRTADWFGIGDIFCSRESVDAFSPKVVQASMGSLSRVRVHYEDPVGLIRALKEHDPEYPVTGTVTGGKNIYGFVLPPAGMVVFGNESRGLSPMLLSMCDRLVSIPPMGKPWADSLNVGVSVAIVCAEWRRRDLTQNGSKA